MNVDHRPRIDYSHRDYASLREAMLGLARKQLPQWSDQSPNDLGVVLVELFAYMGDILHYYLDRIANESYLDTAVEPRSVIHLLRLIGYELRPPRPASADLTLAFDADTDFEDPVVIPADSIFETDPEVTGEKIWFRYVRESLAVDVTLLPTDGRGRPLFVDLPVVQVDARIADEIVGSSDGTAGQRFVLAEGPLIDGSLRFEVDEGAGPVIWQRVPSLLYSVSTDPHYVVRRDEHGAAWVELGDGRYGSIPRRGEDNVTASYLAGGGEKGNVPADSIVTALTEIAGLDSVTNPGAAGGGVEREPMEEAVVRGPQLFRAMGRAVTARDYEAWAREFGVGKVRVQTPAWNRIDIVVAPAGGGYPSETLKEDLRTFLDDKRMVTSIIDIRDPLYINVDIRGILRTDPLFLAEQVRQQAVNVVRDLLAFERIDFGHTLYLSKIYEAIEAVEGVASVYIRRLSREETGRSLPPQGKLDFVDRQLPLLANLELTL